MSMYWRGMSRARGPEARGAARACQGREDCPLWGDPSITACLSTGCVNPPGQASPTAVPRAGAFNLGDFLANRPMRYEWKK